MESFRSRRPVTRAGVMNRSEKRGDNPGHQMKKESGSVSLLPRFGGRPLDVLVSTVDFVHAAVRKELWTIDRVQQEFGRRTCVEILDDGTTFAYAPCPERTLVAAAIVLAHEMNPILVYHERRVYGFGPSTAHFAIEVTPDGVPYMFDFGTRESRLVAGAYYFAEDWEETIVLERVEINSVDSMTMSVEALAGDRMTSLLDLDKKVEWYRSQLIRPRKDILEDRITFAKEFSVVHGI